MSKIEWYIRHYDMIGYWWWYIYNSLPNRSHWFYLPLIASSSTFMQKAGQPALHGLFILFLCLSIFFFIIEKTVFCIYFNYFFCVWEINGFFIFQYVCLIFFLTFSLSFLFLWMHVVSIIIMTKLVTLMIIWLINS